MLCTVPGVQQAPEQLDSWTLDYLQSAITGSSRPLHGFCVDFSGNQLSTVKRFPCGLHKQRFPHRFRKVIYLQTTTHGRVRHPSRSTVGIQLSTSATIAGLLITTLPLWLLLTTAWMNNLYVLISFLRLHHRVCMDPWYLPTPLVILPSGITFDPLSRIFCKTNIRTWIIFSSTGLWTYLFLRRIVVVITAPSCQHCNPKLKRMSADARLLGSPCPNSIIPCSPYAPVAKWIRSSS